jgi:putative ABC transport system permease protein
VKTFALMALRNLFRNPRRSLSTAVAAACGFAGIALTIGFIVRTSEYLYSSSVYLKHTGHIQVYARGGLDKYLSQPSKFSLTPEVLEKILPIIESDSRVEHWGKFLVGSGLAGNGCQSFPFFAVASDSKTLGWVKTHPHVKTWAPGLIQPKSGVSLSESQAPMPIALATGLARRLGKSLTFSERKDSGNDIPFDCDSESVSSDFKKDANVQLSGMDFSGNISMIDVEIANYFTPRLEAANNLAIETTLPTLQALFGTEDVTYLAVFLKNARDTQKVKEKWEDLLKKNDIQVDLFAYDNPEIAPDYVNTMRFMYTMGILIILIVVGVVTVGIANSVYLNIMERIKEMGTLLAMGFTRRHIRNLFVLEAIFLSGMASAFGGVLALVVAAGVNHAKIFFDSPGEVEPIQFLLTPSWPIVVGAWIFVQVSVVLATFWILGKNNKSNPAQMLSGDSQ